jgi:hypothetical protein
MRLRSHRRNLVVWSQSAGSVGRYSAPPFTRTSRFRRWTRTGALLTIVGLMPLARAVRARWRPLLAGGCSRWSGSCGSTARAAWFSSSDCCFSCPPR